MYQFSGKLKMLSLALMIIGALGVGYSFYNTSNTTLQDAKDVIAAAHSGEHGSNHAVNETVTTMAAKHMLEIDSKSKTEKDKLFVFDAGHSVDILATQSKCQNSDIIKRVKSDQVFYYQPKYQGIGRPAKYGEKIKLNSFAKEANQELTVKHKNKTLRITSWQGLQAKAYMDIPLTILKLEFLDSINEPMFNKPICLITTATQVNPETIARAYLWRASHELTFRFMKQHLGLLKNWSSKLINIDNWYQLVAIAMNILLAIKDDLSSKPKPWYPIPNDAR